MANARLIKKIHRFAGFTLAELLIALGILGIIATFTIPKILNSQADQKKRAILKETISMIADISHAGRISGDMTPSNSETYVFDRINAIKICSTDSSVQGCAPPTADDTSYLAYPGVVLASGAMVTRDPDGLNWLGHCTNYYFIDWNGADAPNTAGNDQIELEYNCGTTPDPWTANRPGVLTWNGASGAWPSYQALYENLFSQ